MYLIYPHKKKSSTLLCKLCVHYANGFDNVESVYFFYSHLVLKNNYIEGNKVKLSLSNHEGTYWEQKYSSTHS
jgi:hypothetical protein